MNAGTDNVRLRQKFRSPLAMKNAAILSIFVVAYFFIRAPYFSQKLTGDEGLIAYIFLNHPTGPNYGLYGRIDGREILGPLQHPALPYRAISGVGALIRRFIDLRQIPEVQRTVIMRVILSLFQLGVWALMLLLVLLKRSTPKIIDRKDFTEGLERKISNPEDQLFIHTVYKRDVEHEVYRLKKTLDADERRNLLRIVKAAKYLQPRSYQILFVFLISASPLAVVTSTQLYTDGSIGALLIGLLFLAFAVVWYSDNVGASGNLLVFFGSLAAALGKNEWSLALLLAQVSLVVWVMVLRFIGRGTRRLFHSVFLIIFFSCLGMIIGNAVSFIIDPLNYRGGLDVMSLFSHASLSNPSMPHPWVNYFFAVFPYTFTVIILFVSCAAVLCSSFKKISTTSPGLVLLFFYSSVLFAGYLIFPWSASARYFTPALVGFSITFLALSEFIPQRIQRRCLVVLFAVVLDHAFIFFLSTHPNRASQNIALQPQACVQLIAAADGYFDQQINFITVSFGRETAEKLAQQYGKSLCQ